MTAPMPAASTAAVTAAVTGAGAEPVRPARLARLRAAVGRRLPEPGDDRGSLPMALLLIMVGMALAAALLPTMIVQDRASVFDGSRMNNLAAAQAGIDVVAGDIRAASTASSSGVVGNVAALPCATSTNPITGVVNGVGNAAYSAYVSYYVVDPVSNPTAKPMLCVAGSGTYDPSTATVVPSYAQITSTGTSGATATNGASVSRTLSTTYVFQTSNANIPAGQIRIWPNGSASWCMDAGSTQPQAGTVVTLQQCSTTTPPSPQQLFFYRSDLTIQLATSITTGYPNGLCLDTSSGTSGPNVGNTVVLNQCRALGSPAYSQQWSFNDNGGFTASVSTSAVTGSFALPGYSNGLCMSAASQSAGQQLTLADCNSGNTASTSQAWLPAPTVGDGAAAAPQLVNYQQFGRCLDITGQDVNANPLIAYPCKQNPLAAAVAWNQKFAYSSTTGWLTTTTNGMQYCLYSPNTEGGYVRLTPCLLAAVNGIRAAQLVWTAPGNTSATPYSQRYTFVDSSMDTTRCLSISAPPAGNSSNWWFITVTTCNGSTAQKWNADPNLGVPALQNTVEK